MYESKSIIRNRWFYFIQIIVDTAIIIVTYYLGFKLQRPELFEYGVPNEVIITLIYISIISMVFFLALKLHTCGQKAYSLTIFYLLVALPITAFLGVGFDFMIKGVGIWRRTIFYAISFQVPTFIIVKFIFYKIHRYFIKPIRSIIIGCTCEEAAELFLSLSDSKNNRYDVRYLISETHKDLHLYMKKAEQVLIGPFCEKKTEIMEYCAANNIDCIIVPDFSEILTHSGKFNNINDLMIFEMKIKMDIEARIVKRALDIVISLISIIILSPLMLIIAILIKICDKGKIVYSQTRLTRGNKEFTLYKFRTMIKDAEKETGAVLAELDDIRVTKLGKFLRVSRMDEVLQLFNVLRGEMSLVGPRPERPQLIEETIKSIPEFSYRTLVKAGLTGLAQTLGRYDTSFENKLRFDLYYVNNYSLLLDLKILFYTFHTLFTPAVAAGVNNETDRNIYDKIKEQGIEYSFDKDCLIFKDRVL